MKKIYLNISGMKCEGCVNNVKNTLMRVKGTINVEVELASGKAKIVCEDNVKPEDFVCSINNNTSYKASFEKEENN